MESREIRQRVGSGRDGGEGRGVRGHATHAMIDGMPPSPAVKRFKSKPPYPKMGLISFCLGEDTLR